MNLLGHECKHGASVSELAENLRASARKNFDTDGYIRPIIILLFHGPAEGGLTPIFVLPEHFRDADDKSAFAASAKAIARQRGAVAAVGIFEAWSVRGAAAPAALKWKEDHGGSLHDYPGRIEIAGFMLETRAGGVLQWEAPIERPEGAPPTLGEWTMLDPRAYAYGTFIGIIEPQRAEAQA